MAPLLRSSAIGARQQSASESPPILRRPGEMIMDGHLSPVPQHEEKAEHYFAQEMGNEKLNVGHGYETESKAAHRSLLNYSRQCGQVKGYMAASILGYQAGGVFHGMSLFLLENLAGEKSVNEAGETLDSYKDDPTSHLSLSRQRNVDAMQKEAAVSGLFEKVTAKEADFGTINEGFIQRVLRPIGSYRGQKPRRSASRLSLTTSWKTKDSTYGRARYKAGGLPRSLSADRPAQSLRCSLIQHKQREISQHQQKLDRYGSLRKAGPSLQKDPDFADELLPRQGRSHLSARVIVGEDIPDATCASHLIGDQFTSSPSGFFSTNTTTGCQLLFEAVLVFFNSSRLGSSGMRVVTRSMAGTTSAGSGDALRHLVF
ncbi:hypothetical protein K438DRAFT_1773446 [Mycena galopus ATCC 62051]|nr:hypothetical protein K438DRAFT_1773446 [Mycena galopus ATCC 62051]